MKYLILGSNGMIGHVVALYLHEHCHDVTGYDETVSELFPSISGNLCDTERLKDIIAGSKFNAVINCLSVVNRHAEENKEKAVFVNSYIPFFLERLTSGTETVVVNRSTDCIFSGRRGGYTLDDTPDGESFYARTKALGEIINDKDITIRTSLVGPESDANGETLFNWYAGQAVANGFANAIWTGLTTIEFAREIEYLVTAGAHGLLQCVPDHSISKYDLLRLFSDCCGDSKKIIKIENDSLDRSLIQYVGDYGLKIPDYRTMISEMTEWIKQHKILYMHYNQIV